MLVARFYLLALSSAQKLLVQAVSISINVVLKVWGFFLILNICTSDRSVIIIIIIIIVIKIITAVNVVTNTQGIWLTLPKCIPLQS